MKFFIKCWIVRLIFSDGERYTILRSLHDRVDYVRLQMNHRTYSEQVTMNGLRRDCVDLMDYFKNSLWK